MTCRACIKLPLDVYGIDAIIDNKMLKPPYIILVHLADLDNGRNPYIGTLKKEEGKILSECYSKIFNEKFLRYVNELLFEMVKTDLGYIFGRKNSHITEKWGLYIPESLFWYRNSGYCQSVSK